MVTVRLPNGMDVLARSTTRGPEPYRFANVTQARRRLVSLLPTCPSAWLWHRPRPPYYIVVGRPKMEHVERTAVEAAQADYDAQRPDED